MIDPAALASATPRADGEGLGEVDALLIGCAFGA